jgi:hypothetical protein
LILAIYQMVRFFKWAVFRSSTKYFD